MRLYYIHVYSDPQWIINIVVTFTLSAFIKTFFKTEYKRIWPSNALHISRSKKLYTWKEYIVKKILWLSKNWQGNKINMLLYSQDKKRESRLTVFFYIRRFEKMIIYSFHFIMKNHKPTSLLLISKKKSWERNGMILFDNWKKVTRANKILY